MHASAFSFLFFLSIGFCRNFLKLGIDFLRRAAGRRVLTSVGDDPHVGLDDLHVDAVLLLSDDYRPPQSDVLPLLLGAVRGDRIVRLAGATPAGRARLWYRTRKKKQAACW